MPSTSLKASRPGTAFAAAGSALRSGGRLEKPYTAGHSERVTLFTDMIAEQLAFEPEQRRWLKRAALLHDIGKLDDAEWEAMRMHAAHSEAILSRTTAFKELAQIAGAHHERLDGKGYPRGIAGDQICLETRRGRGLNHLRSSIGDRRHTPSLMTGGASPARNRPAPGSPVQVFEKLDWLPSARQAIAVSRRFSRLWKQP